jgi:hypothetical protein
MADSRTLKALLAPLLKRRPDLAFARRTLFFVPVTHYLRGVEFIYYSFGDEAASFVMPLFMGRHTVDFRGSRGQYTYLLQGGWQPDFERTSLELCDRLEREALPPIERLDNPREHEKFPHYMFDSWGIPDPPLNWSSSYIFKVALGACYYAEYDRARDVLSRIEWVKEAEMGPVTEQFRYSHSILERGAYLQKALREDSSRVPQLLHDWEEFSVKSMKLAKYWKATPFPCDGQNTETRSTR